MGGIGERDFFGKRGYRWGRLLGQGAFSRVYCIEDVASGNTFACKVSGNRELLRKEADVLDRLRHPLFPEVYGLWQEAGIGFLSMEYVPGSSMEEMLGRRGHFPPGQVVRFGMELAEGLLYLHERPEKLLFRDVKPANIMIRQDGRIKLLDFGCVCGMGDRADAYAGSPGYAAPEQLSGDGILTPACDVYGLGRTLERLLGSGNDMAGKGRRKDSGREARMRKSLVRILEECTCRQPSGRIPDMRCVMEALAEAAEGGRGIWGTGRRRNIVFQKDVFETDFPA